MVSEKCKALRDFGIIEIPAFEKNGQCYQALLISVGYIICDELLYEGCRKTNGNIRLLQNIMIRKIYIQATFGINISLKVVLFYLLC